MQICPIIMQIWCIKTIKHNKITLVNRIIYTLCKKHKQCLKFVFIQIIKSIDKIILPMLFVFMTLRATLLFLSQNTIKLSRYFIVLIYYVFRIYVFFYCGFPEKEQVLIYCLGHQQPHPRFS